MRTVELTDTDSGVLIILADPSTDGPHAGAVYCDRLFHDQWTGEWHRDRIGTPPVEERPIDLDHAVQAFTIQYLMVAPVPFRVLGASTWSDYVDLVHGASGGTLPAIDLDDFRDLTVPGEFSGTTDLDLLGGQGTAERLGVSATTLYGVSTDAQ